MLCVSGLVVEYVLSISGRHACFSPLSSFSKRSVTEQQRDALAAEFNQLNLSKYVQEAVSVP